MKSYDTNSIFFIAGSTTNAVIKHVCESCKEFLMLSNLPEMDFVRKAKYYTKRLDKGGLKEPCLETFQLILHCEHYFNLYEDVIIRNGNSDIIQILVEKINISFPTCCCVKHRIVKHFFNVRSYCIKNYYENLKHKTTVYGSATIK